MSKAFRSDLVEVVCEVRRETDWAYGVSNGTIEMDLDGREKLFWVPKSQVECNDDGTITMPEWLAREKGLI